MSLHHLQLSVDQQRLSGQASACMSKMHANAGSLYQQQEHGDFQILGWSSS